MYSGTLIEDLMAAVERAERGVRQKRMTEEMELQQFFRSGSMQETEQIFVGAA